MKLRCLSPKAVRCGEPQMFASHLHLESDGSPLIHPFFCLSVVLADIEQHLGHGRLRTGSGGRVLQPRRAALQRQLSHPQTSRGQPPRRQRLPGKNRKEGVSGAGEPTERKTTPVPHLKAIFFSRWVFIFSAAPSAWGCSSTGEERRGEGHDGGRRRDSS